MPKFWSASSPKQFLPVLLHPLTLSVAVTVLILWIFPPNIPKYQLTITASNRSDSQLMVFWEDLENDGISDKILMVNYKSGQTGVTVYFQPSGIVKEWNIPGKLVNRYGNEFFAVGESAAGAGKEIFVFTQSNDSIFLNRLFNIDGRENERLQTFVSTVTVVNGDHDANIVSPRLEDLDNDGARELVFGINTGFSVVPRALFICNLATNTILRSIETGNSLVNFLVADLAGGPDKEIVTMGYAPGNITDTTVICDDSSNWTMIFDHRLNLMFPPSEFRKHTGGTYAYAIPDTGAKLRLFVTRSPVKKDHQAMQVFRFDETGMDTLVKEFTEFPLDVGVQMPLLHQTKKGPRLIWILVNGEVFLYDTAFKPVSRARLDQQVSHITSSDLDLDGRPERLVSDYVMNTLTVYRDDFSHPATASAGFSGLLTPVFSLKKNGNAPPEISMCSGNLSYLLACRVNPWWPARWAFWAVIWLGVFLFSLLIRRTTRIQVERRYAAGKKITELQLKIVRNQMDPHFTMNALNAVVEAIGREEKEKARENLLHFSQMYRSLVLSADKIKRTLQEEIDFTESYLALERFRVGGRFEYSLWIDACVDRTQEMPKMVIQSAVENAVKHGLRNKESGGKITVRVYKEEENLVLEISDNGIGRQASAQAGSVSTGKGTEIMAQFFELYHRITGVKVISEITDSMDEAGNAAGTRVKITIY